MSGVSEVGSERGVGGGDCSREPTPRSPGPSLPGRWAVALRLLGGPTCPTRPQGVQPPQAHPGTEAAAHHALWFSHGPRKVNLQ